MDVATRDGTFSNFRISMNNPVSTLVRTKPSLKVAAATSYDPVDYLYCQRLTSFPLLHMEPLILSLSFKRMTLFRSRKPGEIGLHSIAPVIVIGYD